MIFGKSKVQEVILQTIRALSQAVISSFPVLLRLNIVIRWYIEFAFKARETFKIFYIKAHCRIFDSTGSHKPCNALHAWKLQKKQQQTNKLKSLTIIQVFQYPYNYRSRKQTVLEH